MSLEIDLYSGRENPEILLAKDEDKKRILKLLEMTTDRVNDPKLHSDLGYRGIELTLENKVIKVHKEGFVAISENDRTT